jgi:hypothetical protein
MGPDPVFIHSQPNTTFSWPIVFIHMLRLCRHKIPSKKATFLLEYLLNREEAKRRERELALAAAAESPTQVHR